MKEFVNWGHSYIIDFTITINKGYTPEDHLANVFHMTADGDNEKYGDRIPAVYANKNGTFRIDMSMGLMTPDGPKRKNLKWSYNLRLGVQYQITVQQYQESGIYKYEILVDDISKLKEQNYIPTSFPSVKFYQSDSYMDSFNSDWGKICNLRITGMAMRIKSIL